jgi:hypothetical protein
MGSRTVARHGWTGGLPACMPNTTGIMTGHGS